MLPPKGADTALELWALLATFGLTGLMIIASVFAITALVKVVKGAGRVESGSNSISD